MAAASVSGAAAVLEQLLLAWDHRRGKILVVAPPGSRACEAARQAGHAVAVIIPAEQYFQSKDDDIPASFWQCLKESRAGLGVDMETALHEPPPGA